MSLSSLIGSLTSSAGSDSFPWEEVIKGGSTLLTGSMQANASRDAARATSKGAQAAAAANQRGQELGMLNNILLNAPALNTQNVARAELAGILGLNVKPTDYSKYGQYLHSGYEAPESQPWKPRVVAERRKQRAGSTAGNRYKQRDAESVAGNIGTGIRGSY